MSNWIKRLFCKHRKQWFRNIYGDEINITGSRTVWHCPKCDSFIYDRDYITSEMATEISPITKHGGKS